MLTSTPQLERDLNRNNARRTELYIINLERPLTEREWVEADELYQRAQLIRAELLQRGRNMAVTSA